MAIASEIEPVVPGLCLWRFYDPSIKTDLYSTAITPGEFTYLVDPVPLTNDGLAQLRAHRTIGGIVVTNDNHDRAARDYADKLNAPIYSAASQSFPPDLTPVRIEGAAIGEIAIHSDAAGGVVIMGDALINFEPYGFTFLPAKYCSDVKLMRRSLRKLLDYSFERMLFAHGMPILTDARRRLEQLMENH